MEEKTNQIVANAANALEQALEREVNTTTAIVVCFGLTVGAVGFTVGAWLISKGMDKGYDTVIDFSGKVISLAKSSHGLSYADSRVSLP